MRTTAGHCAGCHVVVSNGDLDNLFNLIVDMLESAYRPDQDATRALGVEAINLLSSFMAD